MSAYICECGHTDEEHEERCTVPDCECEFFESNGIEYDDDDDY